MKKERILSFDRSKKLSAEEIENISAGSGATSTISAHATYNSSGGWDPAIDINFDL